MDQERSSGKCYRIEYSEQKGRHFIAARDIQPLEQILVDLPLVTGPPFKAGRPVCLECLCPVTELDEACQNCRFPLCRKHATGLRYHDSRECTILAQYQGDIRWCSVHVILCFVAVLT